MQLIKLILKIYRGKQQRINLNYYVGFCRGVTDKQQSTEDRLSDFEARTRLTISRVLR